MNVKCLSFGTNKGNKRTFYQFKKWTEEKWNQHFWVRSYRCTKKSRVFRINIKFMKNKQLPLIIFKCGMKQSLSAAENCSHHGWRYFYIMDQITGLQHIVTSLPGKHLTADLWGSNSSEETHWCSLSFKIRRCPPGSERSTDLLSWEVSPVCENVEQKKAAGVLDWWSQTAVEDNLFSEGLKSEVMRVCRSQWNMMEVQTMAGHD